ncbi:MAG TPA: hypothetical protein VFI31_01040 [Pirellulales bacterium]|nr:hypothetical protein [Pirellulales bacterium]
MLFDRFLAEFAEVLDDVFRRRDDDGANLVAGNVDAHEDQADVIGAKERAVGIFDLRCWLRRVTVPNLQVVGSARGDDERVDELTQQARHAFSLGRHDAPRAVRRGRGQDR